MSSKIGLNRIAVHSLAVSRWLVLQLATAALIFLDHVAFAGPPNVIVILADDLGYSDLSCYGGEIRTPHIDGLAAGGARFTQFYNSARCCPSRASLMTGLYPTQAGIGDFTTNKPSDTRGPGYLGRLRADSATMAEVLKPSGYGCYYVGKWHMHPQTGPIQRGFDEFYGYTNDHSHDQYDAEYYVRLPSGHKKEIDPAPNKFYATDVFNEYALEFIKQGQRNKKPWLVFLGHSSPHFPIQAPSDRVEKYEEMYRRGWDVLRSERFARMQTLGLAKGDHWKLSPRSMVPVDRDDIANGYPGKENPAWDSLPKDQQIDLARRMSVFAAMVEGIDRGVGQIVSHWIHEPTHLMDVLPTIVEAIGAVYPTQLHGTKITTMEGVSLLPVIQGKKLRERVIGFDHQGAQALRHGDWKIVWSKKMPSKIEWELYNLASDRCELDDLAAKQPERVQAMAAEWDKWARRVGVIWDKNVEMSTKIDVPLVQPATK